MELIEEPTQIKRIVRQGKKEAIVTIYEFPFDWKLLKAEIQYELNQRVEDFFQILINHKLRVFLKEGKRC